MEQAAGTSRGLLLGSSRTFFSSSTKDGHLSDEHEGDADELLAGSVAGLRRLVVLRRRRGRRAGVQRHLQRPHARHVPGLQTNIFKRFKIFLDAKHLYR